MKPYCDYCYVLPTSNRSCSNSSTILIFTYTTLFILIIWPGLSFAQENNIYPIEVDKIKSNTETILSFSAGIGLKYFILKPEGKYFEDDPRYSSDYASFVNMGIKLSKTIEHFFITELKHYRSPIHSYGISYNIFVLTFYYKYKFELFDNFSAFSQFGFNIYSNKEQKYFFSNALDLGIEYQISNVNLLVKNGFNLNIFSGAYLPSFLFTGVIINI